MKLLFLLSASLLAQPADTAAQFYTAYRSTAMSGLPDAAAMQKLAPMLSTKLKSALRAAQAQQTRCMKTHPGDKPPFVEGDLFSSNFEGFTAFRVEAGGAFIHFEYAEGKHKVSWKDEVKLVQEGGRWVIDDVLYGRAVGRSLRKSLAERGC
jgi:Protein of unknown function (DUF3828)